MVDSNKKIAAEKANVAKVLASLAEALGRKKKSTVELAAMGTFLHNIYNGIENILKQILKAKGVKVPRSQMWHKELLELSVSKGLISSELCDKLYEYLTFRHFFVHSYGFMLEEGHLENLARNISGIWQQFLSEVEGSGRRPQK
jgi:uncharacterized protein YutE (UPF0331/DUF86 family)